ncbi:hypothetical protein [Clostridium ihumii]|uniref:hypothetical protein n=1 Tax=Clostridium ihumii TaxID=1470356 RepID=UPI003D35260E
MDNNYYRLNYLLNRFQWENYVEGKENDLNSICNEMYINIENMDLNRYLIRDKIEKNPRVSILKNKIDDYWSRCIANKCDKNLIAQNLHDDVIKLINIREEVSKEIGFSSYKTAIMKSEELNISFVKKYLNSFIEHNIDKVKNLINKYNIKWNSWFKDLNLINCKFCENINSEYIIFKFAKLLGMEEALKYIKVETNNNFYFATKVGSDDIRICISNIKTLDDYRTLCHELGHAFLYYYSSIENEKNYFKITPCVDEVIAVIFENIGIEILCSAKEKEKLRDIISIEYTRTALSALLEFEILQNPNNAEELFIKYYSMLGIDINNANLWCLDSFRSIDSMYIYSYTLGQIVADQYLKMILNINENYIELGQALKSLCMKASKESYKKLFNMS